MTQEEIIKNAAEYLYFNLPDTITEEEKQWWINDFVDYMNNIL